MTNLVPQGLPALALFTQVHANGGIQRFNRTWLAACADLGIRCDALSLHDPPDDASGTDGRLIGCGGSRAAFLAATARHLLRTRYRWLIVGHVNFLAAAAILARLPAAHAPRLLLVAHGIEVWGGLAARRRRALESAARILCVSEYTRSRLLQQVPGLDPSRLTIFPNALDGRWTGIVPVEPAGPLPGHFLLSVTRLERGDRYKGVVATIEALAMSEDATLHYVIVGGGDDEPFLRWTARRFGVEDRVWFLGRRADAEIATLYGRCVAFVLPSGGEGFGIVYLEAMYFGAPVIAAAEKGAVDVVRDGETGVLVRYGDAAAIAAAVARLQRDGDLRARLTITARAQVTGEGPFTQRRFTARCAAALA